MLGFLLWGILHLGLQHWSSGFTNNGRSLWRLNGCFGAERAPEEVFQWVILLESQVQLKKLGQGLAQVLLLGVGPGGGPSVGLGVGTPVGTPVGAETMGEAFGC